MVKKRRKTKPTETKEKILPDPDPNSEDFMYDEVDKFHRNKDKILLDARKKDEESEIEESENEEVLGLDSDSDDEEEEQDEEEEENEEEDENEEESSDEGEEKGLPSDQAWGKIKKQFYSADVEDADVYASDEEAELAAQEEEAEALSLQKRMAARLDEEDFYTVEQDEDEEDEGEKDDLVTKDLTKLSKREKLQILNKDSPELLPLVNEYQECLKELKLYYSPLLKLSQEVNSSMTKECKLFVQMKHQLLMNYLVNISFYLAMKAKKEDLKGHPIVDVLYRHRELLSQMKDTHEKLIAEYETIENNLLEAKEQEGIVPPTADLIATKLDKPKKKKKVKTKQLKKKEADDDEEEEEVDPLAYYNAIKQQIEKKKLSKKQGIDEEEEENKVREEFDEDGKRMITYEMSKNKGLTRQRRKELRNPRVKHKMKFKKAKIKHKGQVREVQIEQNRYGGELTGIKSTLSRSVRIK